MSALWNFEYPDRVIASLEGVLGTGVKVSPDCRLKTGIDIGTAYIVMVVLREDDSPVACEMEYAEVVRDGLVVDYLGCCAIVRRLKERIEKNIGRELYEAAIAVPPGTSQADCATHRHVAESAGFDVLDVLDEPTAANAVLCLRDGAVADIGGGTVGVSVFESGRVVYVADEPTGGTHMTLVIAGNKRITFDDAEKFKKDIGNEDAVLPIVAPVIEKMGTIIKKHIAPYGVKVICLAGGACCTKGIESILEKVIGTKVVKPKNPFLVTPLGIAMMMGHSAKDEIK